MHHGAFIGKETKNMSKRALILAESHHISKGNPETGVRADYETEDVIRKDFYTNPNAKNYRLFGKIMQCFEMDPDIADERMMFWERVYFANYIDILCGIGDTAARNTINANGNRLRYNDDLFSFLNEQDIEYIFCFSRLVYNNLPGYTEDRENRKKERFADYECGKTGDKRDYISKCVYLPGIEHGFTNVKLNHSVTVYGMRHPSAKCGFEPAKYTDTLKPIFISLK